MPGINPSGWSEGHYACVIGYNGDNLILQDPVDGRVEMPLAEFDRRWHDQEADGRKYVRWGMAVGGALAEARQKGTCKAGQRADVTGCTPATSSGPAAKSAGSEPLAGAFASYRQEHPAGDAPAHDMFDALKKDNPSMTPEDYRKAVVKAHIDGTMRMSGWSGPIDSIPRPELAVELHNGQYLPLASNLKRREVNNSVYYWVRPGAGTKAMGEAKLPRKRRKPRPINVNVSIAPPTINLPEAAAPAAQPDIHVHNVVNVPKQAPPVVNVTVDEGESEQVVERDENQEITRIVRRRVKGKK